MKIPGKTKRVLGIDPGIKNLGWGIIEGTKNRVAHVDSGVFNPTDSELSIKLFEIHNFIGELIIEFSPELVAIESVFVSKNVRNTLRLGEVRAAAIIACARADLGTIDIAPRLAKQLITGKGNATKDVVAMMITRILGIKQSSAKLDRFDALAIAVAGLWESERIAMLEK